MDPPSSAPLSQKEKDINTVLRLVLAFNFFFAPFKDGLAPLVSVFLVAVKGWDPGSAGVVWFAKDASSIICQSFIGALIDSSENKRALLLVATIVTSVASISVVWTQNFAFLVVKSIFEGIASCFVQPCKNAIVLGLMGQQRFDEASKANEMADHSGCFSMIIITGTFAFFMYPNVAGMFYIIGASGLLATLSLSFMPLSIREDEPPRGLMRGLSRGRGSQGSLIDHRSSRNLNAGGEPTKFLSILKDRNILLYMSSVFFFHLGNAAILPLLSQLLAIESGRAGIPYTCANVAIAQITSVFAAWAMGIALEKGTRYKIPVLAGYIAAVPLRCLTIVILQMYWPNAYALMATQLLDGIGAGTFGLSVPVMSRALTVGTGRFSFTIGAFNTVHLVGAALSNLIAGYVVTFTSYTIGFIVLGFAGTSSVFLIALLDIKTEESGKDLESKEEENSGMGTSESSNSEDAIKEEV